MSGIDSLAVGEVVCGTNRTRTRPRSSMVLADVVSRDLLSLWAGHTIRDRVALPFRYARPLPVPAQLGVAVGSWISDRPAKGRARRPRTRCRPSTDAGCRSMGGGARRDHARPQSRAQRPNRPAAPGR